MAEPEGSSPRSGHPGIGGKLLPGAIVISGFAVYVNIRGSRDMNPVDWAACILSGCYLAAALILRIREN